MTFVQETIHFWPEILAALTSNHSLPRLYCQRQLHECRTSLWLLEQNKKGIAVLPRLALDYYIGLWGPRPYTQLVALHVNKFDKAISCKKWFRLFRNNWGFYYAKMPMESSLSKANIEQKDCFHQYQNKVGRHLFSVNPDLIFFNSWHPVFGDSIWFPLCLFCIEGMTKFGSIFGVPKFFFSVSVK